MTLFEMVINLAERSRQADRDEALAFLHALHDENKTQIDLVVQMAAETAESQLALLRAKLEDAQKETRRLRRSLRNCGKARKIVTYELNLLKGRIRK